MTPLHWFAAAGVAAVFVVSRVVRKRRIRELLDHVAAHPGIHPRVFFRYWRRRYQPWSFRFAAPTVLQLPVMDFRKGAASPPRLSLLPLLCGLRSTWVIASAGLYARKKWGQDYLHSICDAMMLLWAARMCEVSQLRVEMEGFENLSDIRDPLLVICNHKSVFDFVVVPLALGLARMPQRGPVRLRFMAAKDHFIDNFFVYRILKIGLAMKAVGMIFVDRKGKDRKASVDEAVEQMFSSGVDVVIFPQGTRAWPQQDAMGNRWDAGYFAAGKSDRMSVFGGHLKKGAAHLAMQAAAHHPLSVLPVAVYGTATVYNKQSLKVQLNETVGVRIGSPIRLEAAPQGEPAYSVSVKDLHARMDAAMIEVSGIIPRLEQRLLTDTRRMLRPNEFDEFVQVVQDRRNRKDALFFSVADQIYSISKDAQHGRLVQLVGAARMGASAEDLLAMKKEMAAK